MPAIIGVLLQDALTGSAAGDMASYAASPLRAFQVERDVGFTADGSVTLSSDVAGVA